MKLGLTVNCYGHNLKKYQNQSYEAQDQDNKLFPLVEQDELTLNVPIAKKSSAFLVH